MPDDKSALQDKEIIRLLRLFEQGAGPGRLRPDPLQVARSVMATTDPNGTFGTIAPDLRRNSGSSIAEQVVDQAREWISDKRFVDHPVGLTLGCFPAGIDAGCRKHLECPSEIESQCPFGEAGEEYTLPLRDLIKTTDRKKLSSELDKRLQDNAPNGKNEDVIPVLRHCPFNGCVRPEKVARWREQRGIEPSADIRELVRLAATDREAAKQRFTDATAAASRLADVTAHTAEFRESHYWKNSLDALCPHFRRTWSDFMPSGEHDESSTSIGLNEHRFLQCALSRPWSVYGIDPASQQENHIDKQTGLPSGWSRPVRDGHSLSEPDGIMELPVRWIRRAGFSGVGVIVVNRREDGGDVYYLQMNSSTPLLRDYYEMPYFWLGEERGKGWRTVLLQLREHRPQYLQALFRASRYIARQTGPDSWKPEVAKTFEDGSSRSLSPFGRGRFLYCPDGEISFFLLGLRLLLLIQDQNEEQDGESSRAFREDLQNEFAAVLSKELYDFDKRQADSIFARLLNFTAGGNCLSVRDELVALGLMDPLTNESRSERHRGKERPARLDSLISWLGHFQGASRSEGHTGHLIPLDFLYVAGASNASRYPVAEIVNQFAATLSSSDVDTSRRSGEENAVTAGVTVLRAQLHEIIPHAGAGIHLRAIVEAFLAVYERFLASGMTTDALIQSLVKCARFPIVGYYAWRSSGTRDFILGHFAVPIGQANSVTSRESEEGVPWREDSFFLAGIDELALTAGSLYKLKPGGGRPEQLLARNLENVALLGRALFAPLTESTSNYTIFQTRLAQTRDVENRAAEFKAHQLNQFIRPIRTLIALPETSHGRSPADLLRHLASSVRHIELENKIYLDMARGYVVREAGDDYDYHLISRFITDVVHEYQQWAVDSQATDRQKAIEISALPLETGLFPSAYVGTILWELINNHQKHSPKSNEVSRTTTVLRVNASLDATILTLAVSDVTLDQYGAVVRPQVATRTQKPRGYKIGQEAIARIVRFMMNYPVLSKCPLEPTFSDGVPDANYESCVKIDLSRLHLRFG